MLREAANATRSSARARASPATTARRRSRGSTHPAALPSRQAATSISADSNNHVIRRIDARDNTIVTVVGNNAPGPGFSGDFGPATSAQLDTPDGVAVAPGTATSSSLIRTTTGSGAWTGRQATSSTIAGSGDGGYDGDDKPAIEAALNTPSAVATAPSGDIYIADTLNYRIRMIDHATGFIHTIAGDGRRRWTIRSATAVPPRGRSPEHAERRRDWRPTATSTSPTCTISACARVDARTRIITTVAGSGRWWIDWRWRPGHRRRSLAGPAGIAVVPDELGLAHAVHRRLLQRPRARRRTRRDHPRRRIRSPHRVWRSDARFALCAAQGSPLADCQISSLDRLVALRIHADAVVARAPRPAASSAASLQPPKRVTGDLMTWILSLSLAVPRRRLALLAMLLLAEVGLGALQPWPLKVVIDNVTEQRRASVSRTDSQLDECGHAAGRCSRCSSSSSRLACCSGRQSIRVRRYGTQVQVDAGTADGLRPGAPNCSNTCRRSASTTTSRRAPATPSTASTSTRYAIENLVMSGVFPLATSVHDADRDVRRACSTRDVTVALLSLAVVPFLYLCLRYYATTLVNRKSGSRSSSRSCSSGSTKSFSAIRLVKSFAREPYEAAALRDMPATQTMNARIAITWQAVAVLASSSAPSRFSAPALDRSIVGGMPRDERADDASAT